HSETAAHLAIHLDDDGHLVLGQRGRIDLGPALSKETLAVTELGPQLLRDVRAERPEQEERRFDAFPQERATLGGGDAVERRLLEGRERGGELQYRADRGVEVEVAFDVGGRASDRLVDEAPKLRERWGG